MGEFPVLGFGAHMLRAFLLLDNLILFIAAIVELVGVAYYATIFALVNTWYAPCVILGTFLLLLSLVGIFGVIGNLRFLLGVYILVNILLGLALLIVSSYALSLAGEGASFVTTAWQNSPASVLNRMQITFACCGLNSFMDAWAVTPCPYNADTRCMDPLLVEFDQYSTEVPTVGLIVWAVLWLIAGMTFQLTRLIQHAKHAEEF